MKAIIEKTTKIENEVTTISFTPKICDLTMTEKIIVYMISCITFIKPRIYMNIDNSLTHLTHNEHNKACYQDEKVAIFAIEKFIQYKQSQNKKPIIKTEIIKL